MYPVSDAFINAVVKGGTWVTTAEIWERDEHMLADNVPVIGGSLTVDSDAAVRRRISLQIACDNPIWIPEVSTDLLYPVGREIRPYAGYRINGVDELVPLGVFRISKPDTTFDGEQLLLTVDGYDRSRQVSRAKFTQPWVVSPGSLYTDIIRVLILRAFPWFEDEDFQFMESSIASAGTLVWDSNDDPWKVVSSLAESLGAELFFDVFGKPVLQPLPDPDNSEPVWSYIEGSSSTIGSVDKDLDDEEAFNGVVATGQSSAQVPVRAEAWDTDPDSATYYDPDVPGNSAYGPVPFFLDSQYITTQAQAQEAADGTLRKKLGVLEHISFTGYPNPAHDVNDVVAVVTAAAKVDIVNVIDSFTLGLAVGSVLDASTRKHKLPVVVEGPGGSPPPPPPPPQFTLPLLLAAGSATGPDGTVTTNLPNENVWPGAESAPYICNWINEDEFVQFDFNTPAGLAYFQLRYSAGNGLAHRKIELDGSVLAANQALPSTANWNTWAKVELSATLTEGHHTLKVWFNGAAGSDQYINLDNLRVTDTSMTSGGGGPSGPPGGKNAIRAAMGSSQTLLAYQTATTSFWNANVNPKGTPISWSWHTETCVETTHANYSSQFGVPGGPVGVFRFGSSITGGADWTPTTVNAGTYDANIATMAGSVQATYTAQGNVPQIIRPFNEGMDANWMPWACSASTITAWCTAFARIVSKVRLVSPTAKVTITGTLGCGGGTWGTGADAVYAHSSSHWMTIVTTLHSLGCDIDYFDLDCYSDGPPSLAWLNAELAMVQAFVVSASAAIGKDIQIAHSEWGIGDLGGLIPGSAGSHNIDAVDWANAFLTWWANLPQTGPASLGHIELFDGSVYPSNKTATTASGSSTTSIPVLERSGYFNGVQFALNGSTVVTLVSGGGTSGPGTFVVTPAISFANGAAVWGLLPDARGVSRVPDPIANPDGIRVASAIKAFLA